MDTYDWYKQLKKPSWAPPSWLFGPVWTVLYILIAVAFGTVFYRAISGKLALLIARPLALKLVFNLSFTPIQFGVRKNFLAAIDILLVLGTLIWALAVIFSHISWVVYINIPYLLWGSFATVLQFTVTYLNRHK